MRNVKCEFKHLDFLFRQENKLTSPTNRNVVSASYQKAEMKNPHACEVARRRYRKREHRLATCRQMYISESNYYRLLSRFLQIAKGEYERIFPA